MPTRHVFSLAATLSVCACIVPRAGSAQQAFVDVNVIAIATDGVQERQTVVVQGGRIVQIGPAANVTLPPGTARIDARGKYIMPGLGDAHAHLSTMGGGPAIAERALDIYPLFGVTMIRSMYTEPHHRTLLASSEGRTWPRTVMVSPPLGGQTAPTPQAARDSLRSYKAQGYTIAKVMPGLTRETFEAIVAGSKALDMSLTGHVPASVGLELMLAARFSSIEHLDGLMEVITQPGANVATQSGFFGFGLLDQVDESRIGGVVKQVKASGVAIVPTEIEMERFTSPDSGAALARRPEMRLVPEPLVRMWTQQKDNFVRGTGVTTDRYARYRDVRRRLIRGLHAEGVPIAAGSDAFNLFAVPGASLLDELQAYVEAGMSRQQALRSATLEVARLLRLPHVTGTVEVGAVADLVLLEGNPLDDLRHLSQLAGVMLGGRWLDRAQVDRMLEALSARR